MIDRREIKKHHDEINDGLKNLSDTDVLLEFAKLMASIYPHLIKVSAQGYDEYDSISENLFFDFVYMTFSAKYGALINKEEIHRYGFSLHCYHKINHIIIKPKAYPLVLASQPGEFPTLTEDFLNEKELIFIQFGDTLNNLTGDTEQIDTEKVNFNFTEFALVDSKSGLNFRECKHYWVDNRFINYELILEDYDKSEHQFYKQNKFADSNSNK